MVLSVPWTCCNSNGDVGQVVADKIGKSAPQKIDLWVQPAAADAHHFEKCC